MSAEEGAAATVNVTLDDPIVTSVITTSLPILQYVLTTVPAYATEADVEDVPIVPVAIFTVPEIDSTACFKDSNSPPSVTSTQFVFGVMVPPEAIDAVTR